MSTEETDQEDSGAVSAPPAEALVSTSIERSPADLLRLVVAAAAAVVLLVFQWLFGNAWVGFVSDLLRGLSALPQWVVDVVVDATRIVSIVVLVAGLAWTMLRNRTRAVLTVVVGIGIGAVLVALLDDLPRITSGAAHIELTSWLGPLTDAGFPSAYGIVVLAAGLTAGAPWLSRGWRRWGWLAVAGLVMTRFLVAPTSFDSVRSAMLGWLGGAAALVVLGAPTKRATAQGIIGGLAAVGLPLATLEPAGVDARGSTPYFGAARDGSRYFVKALGQDQRSADLLFRLYRWVQRKDLGDERPFSSLRRTVEHEAFVALGARDLGVRTPRMRAFAVAEPSTLVLAYEAIAGRSLDRLQPEEITDGLLHDIWVSIGQLRAHRIAHRDLRLANLFFGDDGQVWMIDFGFSEMAASDLLLANDVAELVASSSVVVGAERATSHALATVDPDTLERAVGRLQPWALSGATRTALKAQPGLLDDLRRRLAGS